MCNKRCIECSKYDYKKDISTISIDPGINTKKSSCHFTVPPQTSAFDIETSHLRCRAKQMTGFYMKCSTPI